MPQATDHDISIPVQLPPAEALALASVFRRMDLATVHALAAPSTSYDGRSEGDAAYAGITRLCGALAAAGCVAR